MIINTVTAVSLSSGNTSVMLDFDQIRRELRKMPDKNSYELVRLVRRHKTKERLMKLITDRVQPNTIPTMDTIANIVKSVSDTYLGTEEVWS